jgi:hypothetical protein
LSRGKFRDGREWSTQVRPAFDGEQADIVAVDIDSLTVETIDLLKVDIEGSEEFLFRERNHWLDRVRNLCVETHGPECQRSVLDSLSGYDYVSGTCGEYQLFLNLRRR